MLDVAARAGTAEIASPTGGGADRFGRIVLPPRTGKTVIAGHIIGRSGLRTTLIVPTRTLVEQTARELGMLLPGVPIGVYFGERKEVVRYGVNVATYSQLLRDRAGRGLPEEIASSALVFADEAHRAMTQDRGDLLRQGFSPGAVHVALTATPDYDHERVLCRWFPRLVHEVTLERGGSPERELRSRGGFAPPPHLAAFRGSCRGCRAWAAGEQERYRPHGWAELPEPLAVRDLLPRAGALLEALGRSSRVTTATSWFRRWVADGATWGEAVWEADGARVALTRHGHATLRHEGDEAEVLRLRAEVSGLPGSALLLVEGRPGALCAFALEGDPSRVVESAWREVCGLEPPPRKGRGCGARAHPRR